MQGNRWKEEPKSSDTSWISSAENYILVAETLVSDVYVRYRES